MYKSEAMDKRFVPYSSFAMIEGGKEIIVPKPLDPPTQEDMLQEARLAGLIDQYGTVDDLYQIFADAGFHKEIIEEASRRRPVLVREHKER